MCHSLRNSRRKSVATLSADSFKSVTRGDSKENKYDPQQTYAEIVQAPSVNLRIGRTALRATSHKTGQCFPAFRRRTTQTQRPGHRDSTATARRGSRALGHVVINSKSPDASVCQALGRATANRQWSCPQANAPAAQYTHSTANRQHPRTVPK
jgi:hypothetical protein